MARTSLVELLPPPADVLREPQTADRASQRPPADDAPTTEVGEETPTPAVDHETGPRYLQMERKEARIRLDQADALAQLTRRLNRARRGSGERITDNTLIRVAVDLLLSQSDRLAGSTEDELRNALSL